MDISNIHRFIWTGRHDINWYQDCETCFVDLFGRDKLQLTAQLFAATSINTSLKANITLFRKALYEIETGLPVSDAYLPNIRNQLLLIRSGQPLSGRKINNFANAIAGDTRAVVVDIWLTRAFGYEKKRKLKSGRIGYNGPTKKQYDSVESWVQEQAFKMNIQPRQLSAMIWAGIRIEQSGDKETHYIRRLKNHFSNLFNCI